MKHLGTQKTLKLDSTSVTYGTCDSKKSNSLFINLSFWLTIDDAPPAFSQERNNFIHHFKSRMSSKIRAMITGMSNNYLYSFNVVEVSDSFYRHKNKGFGSAEIQVFLKTPFIDFNKDMILIAEIEGFCKKLDSELHDVYPNCNISRNHGHANPNKKLVV